MDILCDKCGQPWGDGGSIDLRINHRMCAACTEEWRKDEDIEHFRPMIHELVNTVNLCNQLVDEINALRRRVRQLEGR